MAFTRQLDDTCASKKRTQESTSVLKYILDPSKYYNNNPCFIEKGIVGGNTVSLYSDNIVDLESDLSGRTRARTKCSAGKFLPGTIIQGRSACDMNCGKNGVSCGRRNCIHNKLIHLPKAKMINYQPKIKDRGFELNFPVSSAPSVKFSPAWTEH